MGRKLLAIFKPELEKIKNSHLKEGAKIILNDCTDWCAIQPASSSGKYHPLFSLGEGGLVRHTKVVCRFTETFMSQFEQYDDALWDYPFIAAMLHDFKKYSVNNQEHTDMEHPILMRDFISEHFPNDKDWALIGHIVVAHMSRWNKDKNGKILGEIPSTDEQKLVAMADMTASRKFLHIQFNNYNIVD